MDIFRPATAEETDIKNEGFSDLMKRNTSIGEVFKKKAIDKLQECTVKRKPFCYTCAMADFKLWGQKHVSLMERSSGHADFSKLKDELPNLEEYEKADRFTFVKEQKAMEPLSKVDFNTQNVTRQVQIGVHKDFKCKICNGGISIFIPNETQEMPSVQQSKAKKE